MHAFYFNISPTFPSLQYQIYIWMHDIYMNHIYIYILPVYANCYSGLTCCVQWPAQLWANFIFFIFSKVLLQLGCQCRWTSSLATKAVGQAPLSEKRYIYLEIHTATRGTLCCLCVWEVCFLFGIFSLEMFLISVERWREKQFGKRTFWSFLLESFLPRGWYCVAIDAGTVVAVAALL